MILIYFEYRGDTQMAVLTPSVTDELMEQLMKIDGKAEIVGRRIQKIMPTG